MLLRSQILRAGCAGGGRKGGCCIAYLTLLVLFGAWAYWAGRGWPLKKLIAPILLTSEVGTMSEFFFGTLLGLYTLHVGFMPTEELEHRMAQLIVRHTLNPLLAVLYVLYRRRSPVWVAVGGGLALGLLEQVLVWVGAVEHTGWNIGYTAIFYVVFFLLLHWVLPHLWRAPAWLITGLFTFAVSNSTSVLLHGIIGLYHYRLPGLTPSMGDKTLTLIRTMLITGPLMALLATRPRPSPLLQTLALAFLILTEVVGLALGWIIYDNWSLGFAALRYAVVVFLAMHFLAWWRKPDQGGEP